MNVKILKALLCSFFLLPGYVWAEDESTQELPTSKYPSERVWDVMNVNANEKTIAAARAQCDRAADMVDGDEVKLDNCAVLEHTLMKGQCHRVTVGEKTFDFLGGPNNSTARNITKQTGRKDPALLCDLGRGIYAYWFMQSSKDSCNNVGIVITDPPPVVQKPVQYAEARSGIRTRMEHLPNYSPTYGVFTPGYLDLSCPVITNGAPGFYSDAPVNESYSQGVVIDLQ